MANIFRDIFRGKVVIVGIGNRLRSDDGFGPMLIDKLKEKTKIVCLDAGNAAENYIGKIVKEKPDTVLIVDAVDLNLPPGKYKIIKPAEIIKSGFSTHDLSPRLFFNFLEKQSKANILVLGVQPQKLEMGEGLSKKLREVLQELSGLIIESLKEANYA